MNENEKKAIESLKVKIEFMGDNYYKIMSSQAFNDLRKETKVALNLIEKLQKENEELNRKFKVQLETNLRLVDARNGIENEEIRQLNNFIKNDCILKDKIEEIKSKNIGQYMNFYREIEELLKEE